MSPVEEAIKIYTEEVAKSIQAFLDAPTFFYKFMKIKSRAAEGSENAIQEQKAAQSIQSDGSARGIT